MSNEASQPGAEEKPHLVVTEAMISEAAESFGAPIHQNCPRCGSDKWNISATSPDRIVTSIPYDKIDIYRATAFYLDCGNCGFLEHYKWDPFLDFWLNKNG